jgi:hypothetical protein
MRKTRKLNETIEFGMTIISEDGSGICSIV